MKLLLTIYNLQKLLYLRALEIKSEVIHQFDGENV